MGYAKLKKYVEKILRTLPPPPAQLDDGSYVVPSDIQLEREKMYMAMGQMQEWPPRNLSQILDKRAEEEEEKRRNRQIYEGFTLDLAFVSSVVDTVVNILLAHADNVEDVVVAAKYIEVSRQFPIAFLRWAASISPAELEIAAKGGVPEWGSRVRRMCEENPVISTITKKYPIAAHRINYPHAPLPSICTEAFILANAVARSEADLLTAQRAVKGAAQINVFGGLGATQAPSSASPYMTYTGNATNFGSIGGGIFTRGK
jgi:hypothetical protein